MPSNSSEFTKLERAVLSAICDGYPEDRGALQSQLSKARIVSRENTGTGFYTHFAVERIPGASLTGERLRNGPAARISGLEHGMGFILWLEGGHMDKLEGYCYDESTKNLDFERIAFEIQKPSR